MPTLEQILEEKTYKGQCDYLSQRVFYTLAGEQSDPSRETMQRHRTMKAVTSLIVRLRKRNVIDDDDVDEILLSAVDHGQEE